MREIFKKVYYELLCEYYTLSCPGMDIYEKIKYIFNKFLSIILNKREIAFKNYKYHYDNRIGPAVFQIFPKEIERLKKIGLFNGVKSILDIGANTGQWSFAVKTLVNREMYIYSFEPIPQAYNSLYHNSIQFKRWDCFNLAISPNNKNYNFFYSPEGSTTGSFSKDKVEHNFERDNIELIKIKGTRLDKKNLNKYNIPLKVDLIKIDVEGYEFEILESIKDLSFNKVYVEIHLDNNYPREVDQFVSILEKKFNSKFKLIYLYKPKYTNKVVEVYLKKIKTADNKQIIAQDFNISSLF